MIVAKIPAAISHLAGWSELYCRDRSAYTPAARRRLIAYVIHNTGMTDEEACEFEQRALPRAAFASPETFALRVIQTLSEVCR